MSRVRPEEIEVADLGQPQTTSPRQAVAPATAASLIHVGFPVRRVGSHPDSNNTTTTNEEDEDDEEEVDISIIARNAVLGMIERSREEEEEEIRRGYEGGRDDAAACVVDGAKNVPATPVEVEGNQLEELTHVGASQLRHVDPSRGGAPNNSCQEAALPIGYPRPSWVDFALVAPRLGRSSCPSQSSRGSLPPRSDSPWGLDCGDGGSGSFVRCNSAVDELVTVAAQAAATDHEGLALHSDANEANSLDGDRIAAGCASLRPNLIVAAENVIRQFVASAPSLPSYLLEAATGYHRILPGQQQLARSLGLLRHQASETSTTPVCPPSDFPKCDVTSEGGGVAASPTMVYLSRQRKPRGATLPPGLQPKAGESDSPSAVSLVGGTVIVNERRQTTLQEATASDSKGIRGGVDVAVVASVEALLEVLVVDSSPPSSSPSKTSDDINGTDAAAQSNAAMISSSSAQHLLLTGSMARDHDERASLSSSEETPSSLQPRSDAFPYIGDADTDVASPNPIVFDLCAWSAGHLFYPAHPRGAFEEDNNEPFRRVVSATVSAPNARHENHNPNSSFDAYTRTASSTVTNKANDNPLYFCSSEDGEFSRGPLASRGPGSVVLTLSAHGDEVACGGDASDDSLRLFHLLSPKSSATQKPRTERSATISSLMMDDDGQRLPPPHRLRHPVTADENLVASESATHINNSYLNVVPDGCDPSRRRGPKRMSDLGGLGTLLPWTAPPQSQSPNSDSTRPSSLHMSATDPPQPPLASETDACSVFFRGLCGWLVLTATTNVAALLCSSTLATSEAGAGRPLLGSHTTVGEPAQKGGRELLDSINNERVPSHELVPTALDGILQTPSKQRQVSAWVVHVIEASLP